MDCPGSIDLSVVIPVYRSELTLPILVNRLLPVLTSTGLRFEIICVDDGSPDNAWRVLNELQVTHPDRIIAIQLMRNFGQHNALMCGLRHCRGNVIITMDDDLQHPPEEIPKLLEAIQKDDLDLVYGIFDKKRHHALRNRGSWLVNVFYRMVFQLQVTITSFRIMRRPLVESIFTYNLNFTFLDGLLAWNTRRIGQVVVAHEPRAQGTSGYSLRKLVELAFNLFTNYSIFPLRLATVCGFVTAALGLVLAVYFLVKYLFANITVPGYASTIVAIFVFGGMQLLALGVIGEYLGRVHLNVNRKPQYTVRQVIGVEKQ